jgi:2,4-dienoyl-CoA reductase (NADPH2)
MVPPGGFPPDELNWWYGGMVSSGSRAFLNYCFFHFKLLRPIFLWLWNRRKKAYPIEGVSAEACREIKKNVSIPVLNTGGYQDGALIRKYISEGWMDGVAIARPLIANRDLPHVLASGRDLPDRPCTFCNRCLVNAIANPLGCYELRRYDGDHDAMIREVMKVYDPPHFPAESAKSGHTFAVGA